MLYFVVRVAICLSYRRLCGWCGVGDLGGFASERRRELAIAGSTVVKVIVLVVVLVLGPTFRLVAEVAAATAKFVGTAAHVVAGVAHQSGSKLSSK
jgi:hypothetical protein